MFTNELIKIGSTATATQPNSISIGNGCTGGTTASSIAVGLNCAVGSGSSAYGISNSIGSDSVSFGNRNTDTTTFGASAVIGSNNTTSGNGSVVVGNGNTSVVGAALVVGNGLTNSTADSFLFGSTTLSNVRAGSTVCDIGTTAARFKDLNMSGSIIGPASTRAVDNLVSTASTGVSGNVTTFSSAKIIQDSGTALSSLATTASLASYLPLTGGTMSGAINMSVSRIRSCPVIESDSVGNNNVIWGTGTTLTPPGNNLRNVALGYNHAVAGFSTVSIGESTTQSVGTGRCVLVGSGLSIAGDTCAVIGRNSNITGNNSFSVGSTNTIGAGSTFVYGNNATNSTANSVLLGDTSVVNIRANGASTCDLGTTAARFKDLNKSGSIIGPTYARTADNVVSNAGAGVAGNVPIFSGTTGKVLADSGASLSNYLPLSGGNMTGTFSCFVDSATWYSVTNYAPSFTAGVMRLIPPTTATNTLLFNYTYTSGILTFLGPRPRNVVVVYNISYTTGVNGSNMIFINSKNGSLVTGTQTQVRRGVNAQNANLQTNDTVIDIISLTSGDTIQLAASCATLSSAVTFNYVSCNVFALLN